MDWQQTGALVIVVATVAAFCRSFLRKRRSAATGRHCACHGQEPREAPPDMVLRGRKGERPQLVVKLK